MSHRGKDTQRLDSIDRRLARIEKLLNFTVLMEVPMSKEMDDLEAQVTAITTAEQSAVALIKGLADQIAAAGTDKAKLAALTASLRTDADDLAAAVTANTPVVPTP